MVPMRIDPLDVKAFPSTAYRSAGKASNAEAAEVTAEERREGAFAPSAQTSASSALLPPAFSLNREVVGWPPRDLRAMGFVGPKHSVSTEGRLCTYPKPRHAGVPARFGSRVGRAPSGYSDHPPKSLDVRSGQDGRAPATVLLRW